VWFVDPKIGEGWVRNSALLDKWLFKLLTEDGVRQTLPIITYVGSKTLSQVMWKPVDSHFWVGLMAMKKHFIHFGYLLIEDGSQIHF
jgi:hypothetical protein